jgi:hypothetical protein
MVWQKRTSKTVMEKACTLLQDTGLSKCFWINITNMAIYLRNDTPTEGLQGVTPEEA